MAEPCECVLPGQCNRHQKWKGAREVELCQTRNDWREMMDRITAEQRDRPTVVVEGPTPAMAIRAFVSSTAKFLWHGAEMTAKEVHDERLAICRGCEQHYREPAKLFGVALPMTIERCRACACEVRLKVCYPHEECPIGNWPAVSDDPSRGCDGCNQGATDGTPTAT